MIQCTITFQNANELRDFADWWDSKPREKFYSVEAEPKAEPKPEPEPEPKHEPKAKPKYVTAPAQHEMTAVDFHTKVDAWARQDPATRNQLVIAAIKSRGVKKLIDVDPKHYPDFLVELGLGQ